MNKIYLSMAVTAAIVASCSSEENVAEKPQSVKKEIKFNTVESPMTKSTVDPTFTSFNVTAINGSSVYFDKANVTKSGTAWATDKIYYWPESGTLTFKAYTPTDIAGVSITPTAAVITGFSPEALASNQKDLMTAYATGTAPADASSNTPVSLNFHHALSQIEVKAQNYSDAYKVEVIGAKLGQIPSTADMTFQTSSTGNVTWTSPTGLKSYGVSKSTSDAITLSTTEAKDIMYGEKWLMIPQQLTEWRKPATGNTNSGAYISILCRITKTADGSQIYPDETGKFAYTSIGINTKWEPGHKYSYTMNFFKDGGGAGTPDPNPSDPTNPSNPDVDTTPGGVPGDPIVGTPINVTVTVTDWIVNNESADL